MSDHSGSKSDQNDQAKSINEGNDIIPLNEETQIALRPETQIALPSEDENQRGVALRQTVIPSFHLNQGSFDKPNFGPQTNTKHIEANTIEHATISHVHHHYGGDGKTEESPSTSGATGARPKQKLEKGFVQLADDIFINTKKPLKEGSKIYEGYQEYVTGQRQRIAIKAIFPCTKKSMREVKHLVTLTPHPNVVRIIQAKENNDHIPTLYIAMELCNSKNLQDYLKENREKNTPFDFKKTMSYCKRLIKGMKHIHRNRIIHGDLKPENILFSLVGDQIKVSDFGISKQLEQAKSKTKRTNQGTDGYRAPETYSSDIISIMADIFSLGVTLYSLWTNGKHPFGENPYQQVWNVINNTGRDLSCLPEEMGTKNDEFIDLLDKMLQVDPKKRPTIEEISQHPFLSSSQATAQASSTRQMSQGTSSEETVPELHFVAPTTPESALAFQETEPKKVREAMLQRPDLGQSPRPENSPEATPTRPESPSTSGATGATRNRTAQKDYHCPEEPSFDIAEVDRLLDHENKIQLRDEAAAEKIHQRVADADLSKKGDQAPHVPELHITSEWKENPQEHHPVIAGETAFTNYLGVRGSTENAYNAHLRDETIYHIDPRRRKGRALIINNDFQGTNDFREGSEVDVRNMQELWTALGFDVVKKMNLTAQQMRDSCQTFAAKSFDISVVVVVIMTHGEKTRYGKECFLGQDGGLLASEDVIATFASNESPQLRGIPKLFFFQAARGCQVHFHGDGVGGGFGGCYLPLATDMLITHSTQPGHVSFRNIRDGSWLMNVVTNIFMLHAHDTHVLEMLTMVNDAMSRKITSNGEIQMSNQENCLKKKLFLYPGWPK